ncbi:heavy-metal resistance protein [Paraburkholderia caballeronis]|uniref:periplasmic heavy metal sensor n=1 Tax=Paraburkholderia caballeronis TaxID=416943 RepID=UPI001065F9A4|nr:periplasmic heavy metal sensor [Paraburkholderia caballeronis]TDV34608.1 heavy-metal resistance protein [Paraburkholderia caballeronis]
MYKKTSRFLAVAATSLALSIGAAHAQTPPKGGPGGPGGWHGHMMKEMQQLHAKLNLNADQEKQWQAALTTMKQNREAARANHKQMKEQFDSLKNQPILDLNALHAAHQRVEQQDAQLREQTSSAWLAFYNGLNDQQKTTVSNALKARFAKMEQRREKMREHWQQHRGAASAPAAQQ